MGWIWYVDFIWLQNVALCREFDSAVQPVMKQPKIDISMLSLLVRRLSFFYKAQRDGQRLVWNILAQSDFFQMLDTFDGLKAREYLHMASHKTDKIQNFVELFISQLNIFCWKIFSFIYIYGIVILFIYVVKYVKDVSRIN